MRGVRLFERGFRNEFGRMLGSRLGLRLVRLRRISPVEVGVYRQGTKLR